MEVDDIISYHDLVTEGQSALQKGMNYGVGKNYSIFLMSLREGAPYVDARYRIAADTAAATTIDDNAKRVVTSSDQKFSVTTPGRSRCQLSRANCRSTFFRARFSLGDRIGKKRRRRRGTGAARVCKRRARR